MAFRKTKIETFVSCRLCQQNRTSRSQYFLVHCLFYDAVVTPLPNRPRCLEESGRKIYKIAQRRQDEDGINYVVIFAVDNKHYNNRRWAGLEEEILWMNEWARGRSLSLSPNTSIRRRRHPIDSTTTGALCRAFCRMRKQNVFENGNRWKIFDIESV